VIGESIRCESAGDRIRSVAGRDDGEQPRGEHGTEHLRHDVGQHIHGLGAAGR
jgi:hypothetical protein